MDSTRAGVSGVLGGTGTESILYGSAPSGIWTRIELILVKKLMFTCPGFLFCLEFHGCFVQVEESSSGMS